MSFVDRSDPNSVWVFRNSEHAYDPTTDSFVSLNVLPDVNADLDIHFVALESLN